MRYGVVMDTRQRQVGAHLKDAREARGLSKRKAARLAGVSESRWRQVENGVQVREGELAPATATPETLVRMGRAVGIDGAAILDEAGYDPGIAQHIPEAAAEAAATVAAPEPDAKVIDVTDLTDNEEQMVRTFLMGIRAGRSGRLE